MNAQELLRMGVPVGGPLKAALGLVRLLCAGTVTSVDPEQLRQEIARVLERPGDFVNDAERGELAKALLAPHLYRPKRTPAPWRQWGEDLEEQATTQMANASLLPVAVKGALMPDAHVGYGLPIGGVLATQDAVIPYAVGVDIACRMKLSVYDCKAKRLAGQVDRLAKILETETCFGVGASYKHPRDHEVMDEDWSVSPITAKQKDKAWGQLGTSGSGNHFVEFGVFTVENGELGLEPGEYIALLSHSGSRGTGAQICQHYSRLAMEKHPDLPSELKHLAWLDLHEQEGQEYWAAMNLMGHYAAANHAVIHRQIARALGEDVVLDIENHHNFAWKERHLIDGEEREVIVHRKGATPAGVGVLGVIPGSMATPGFVVRGLGEPESLHSASHGAGRVMSRSKALQSFTWSAAKKLLAERNVKLLSAGLDEVPMVYKDIHSVMAAQTELVEVLGRFDPRVVKMCPAGEKAED